MHISQSVDIMKVSMYSQLCSSANDIKELFVVCETTSSPHPPQFRHSKAFLKDTITNPIKGPLYMRSKFTVYPIALALTYVELSVQCIFNPRCACAGGLL